MGITHQAGDGPENTPWLTGKQLSLRNSFGVKTVLNLSDPWHLRGQGRGVWSPRTSVWVWRSMLVNLLTHLLSGADQMCEPCPMHLRMEITPSYLPEQLGGVNKNRQRRSFPGDLVFRSLLCNAGDTGPLPDNGRSHMPQVNLACGPQLQSTSSRAPGPQLLKPACLRTSAAQEKPLQ